MSEYTSASQAESEQNTSKHGSHSRKTPATYLLYGIVYKDSRLTNFEDAPFETLILKQRSSSDGDTWMRVNS